MELTTLGKRLYIDYDTCIGCETCEMVCKFVHGQPRIQMTRTVEGVMLPLYCQQCERPMCIKSCPHQAVRRDAQGVIVLDRERCPGCQTRDCLMACPFAAMFITPGVTTAVKCDLCADRRDRGLGPACVAMCPCGAIHYVTHAEAKCLQTPEAMAAFKRVIAHIRPQLSSPDPDLTPDLDAASNSTCRT